MENEIRVRLESTLTGIRAAARDLGESARRRPWIAAAAAAGVLVLGTAAAVALTEPGDSAFLDVFRPQKASLRELARRARAEPRNASAQAAYGRALFDAGRRRAAVGYYRRALARDAGAADRAMVEDLLACFGRKEQKEAEALLARHKLTQARDGLERLARSKRRSVRWGAVQTLEKLGRVPKGIYVQALLLDLDSPDCDVRRRAADRLGDTGDRHALARLRAAKQKDDQETPWYRQSCLGDRVESAEKKILARR